MDGSDFSNLIYANPGSLPYPVLETGYAQIFTVYEDPDNEGDYIYLDITQDGSNGDLVVNPTQFATSSQYCYQVEQAGGIWVLRGPHDAAPYYQAVITGMDSGLCTYYMDPGLATGEVAMNHGRYCTLVHSGGGISTRIRFTVGDTLNSNSYVYHITARVNVSATVSSTLGHCSSTVTIAGVESSILSSYTKDSATHGHFLSGLGAYQKDGYVEISVAMAAAVSGLTATGRIQITPLV